MTTDLNETRLQVLFLPINVYVEDTIVVSLGIETWIIRLELFSIEK